MQNHKKRLFKLAPLFMLVFGSLLTHTGWSQKVAKVTITDQLSSASALSYGTPKPASPKDQFVLVGDKGAKVLVYLSLEPDSSLRPGFSFKYTVTRMKDGKEEWVDERQLELKPTAKYSMAAFTLFEPGRYHFVVTDHADDRSIFAEGWASVIQN